jgi:hypothetical protein
MATDAQELNVWPFYQHRLYTITNLFVSVTQYNATIIITSTFYSWNIFVN